MLKSIKETKGKVRKKKILQREHGDYLYPKEYSEHDKYIWSDQSFYIREGVRLEFSNCKKVHIKNLDIDGTKNANLYVKFNNVDKVIIENITVTNDEENTSFLDLVFHRVNKAIIKNIHLDNAGQKPISISDSNIVIKDSFIKDSNTIFNVSRPKYLDGYDITIESSDIENYKRVHNFNNYIDMDIKDCPKLIISRI